jgi:protein involved in polysaccharide export with SLBB domain
MHDTSNDTERRGRWRRVICLLAGLTASALPGLAGGCAAVTNPVAQGVPVERLPPDWLPRPREEEKPIPLTLLRQKRPDVYRLDAGDVLGVYIEKVLGDRAVPPPVRLAELPGQAPAFGFPIPVREDGNLPLPLVPPIPVKGLTVAEAEERVRKAYTVDRHILNPENDRIVLTLMQKRLYHVLVVREDSGGLTFGPGGVLGNTKRGTGAVVDLPAYENDVLNALTRTGGLPGLDAMNEVVIERGYYRDDAAAQQYLHQLETCPSANLVPPARTADQLGGEVIRIPLRVRPDEPIRFKPEDVVLRTGDIVFIQARDTELFYTGGLLLARQFVLPRDYDLRVVDAIALAGGPLVNGLFQQSNLSGNITASGLGSPSPSQVSILRRTKGYGQVVIHVDLNRALRDPRENILIQAGDVIILQETVGEAVTRYVTNVLRLDVIGTLIRQRDLTATSTLNVP